MHGQECNQTFLTPRAAKQARPPTHHHHKDLWSHAVAPRQSTGFSVGLLAAAPHPHPTTSHTTTSPLTPTPITSHTHHHTHERIATTSTNWPTSNDATPRV